ncbi:formylglycine-generating enzyme family protein [Thorsellia kenyensis]|uniref:Formylglycine-generating enzyme family protein n=1 Tax=Thorsellia kenyensis TaxID=1549888 RepID=A0ABV6C9D5_9GAMM
MLSRFGSVVLILALLTSCKEAPITPEAKAFADSIIADMVPIKGGTYEMGDFGKKSHGLNLLPESWDLKPHQVTLDDFKLAAHRITWAQYNEYAKFADVETTRVEEWTENLFTTVNRNVPIMAASVRWEDAKAFCQWVGKATGEIVDLPTEAQWEYAARNRGQYVVFATDNGEFEPGRNIPSPLKSAPVGQYPPTPLGLYDMLSRDVEWVNDWYDRHYYTYSSEKNPVGPKYGEEKVARNRVSGSDIQNLTIDRSPIHPTTHFIESWRDKKETSGDVVFRCAVHHAPLPEPTDVPPEVITP